MVSLSEGLAILSLMTSAAMHGSSGLNRPPFLGALVLWFLCPLAFLSAFASVYLGLWTVSSSRAVLWFVPFPMVFGLASQICVGTRFGHNMRFISYSDYHKSTHGTTVPVWCVAVPDWLHR